MTMKLYFAPGACSFVPHSLLETAGAEYEPVMVKLHKGEPNDAGALPGRQPARPGAGAGGR